MGSVRAGGGEGKMHACGAHLFGRDREGLGEAGRDFAHSATGAGKMQDADRLEVELIGAKVGLGHLEVAQDIGEPTNPRADRPDQAQPHDLGDLRLQVSGWLADEGERAVEEGGMLDGVVGKRLEAAAQPLPGVTGLFVDSVEQGIDLGQVTRRRQREQLVLGDEVPIDEGLVDANASRDAIDAGVLPPTLVEEGAGRIDNLVLARAADGRGRLLGCWHPHSVTPA
jgi:hypothetical protein